EQTLSHDGEAVRGFYAGLPKPAVVGIEATGSMATCHPPFLFTHTSVTRTERRNGGALAHRNVSIAGTPHLRPPSSCLASAISAAESWRGRLRMRVALCAFVSTRPSAVVLRKSSAVYRLHSSTSFACSAARRASRAFCSSGSGAGICASDVTGINI